MLRNANELPLVIITFVQKRLARSVSMLWDENSLECLPGLDRNEIDEKFKF